LETASELKKESVLLGTPIYWVGPRDGYRYELWRDKYGFIFVRYLPDGVPVRDPGADFLTVATYPFVRAYGTLCALQKAKTGGPQSLDRALDGPPDGIALLSRAHRRSVYVAFPGVDYEIEVYDRAPSEAAKLAVSGLVRPVTG